MKNASLWTRFLFGYSCAARSRLIGQIGCRRTYPAGESYGYFFYLLQPQLIFHYKKDIVMTKQHAPTHDRMENAHTKFIETKGERICCFVVVKLFWSAQEWWV